MEVKINKLECKRCGHIWFPRKEEVMLCSKCHTPYWNRERRVNEPVKQGVQGEE